MIHMTYVLICHRILLIQFNCELNDGVFSLRLRLQIGMQVFWQVSHFGLGRLHLIRDAHLPFPYGKTFALIHYCAK